MNDAVALESPVCPLCGPGAPPILRLVKDGFAVYRCPGCTLQFVWPQPSDEGLRALYDADYFKRGNKYAPTNANGAADPNRLNDLVKINLVRRFKTSGRLLDVGCAMGGFLAVAREHGFDVAGVEIAETAAEHARTVHGLDVNTSPLDVCDFAGASFDVVTMWDVIEHLRDPRPALETVHRILRPGGAFLVSTGDASSFWARVTGRRWQLMTPPQHLYFYTPRSLATALEAHGFDVREFHYAGKRATLDFILFKAREAFGPAVRPFRLLAGALRLESLQLYVNLRDTMTCVAVKNNG